MREWPHEILSFFKLAEVGAEKKALEPAAQQILETINQKVAAAESLAAVLDFVFEASKTLFPCDRISLAFLEDQGRRLATYWVRAEYQPVYLKAGYGQGLAQSSLKQVIDKEELRIINNLEDYLKLKPQSSSTKLLLKEGVKSSLTCPLYVEGRVAGVLFRSSRKSNSYGPAEAYFQAHMAERLGQAVEKAYRIEQLSNLNRSYLELLSFASHELRSPLASLVMDAELLTEGYLGELNTRQREKLESIIKRARNLLDSTRDFLALARYESGHLKPRFEPGISPAQDIIERVLDDLETQAKGREINLSFEASAASNVMTCDPVLLKSAVYNLVSNAIKYGRLGGEVKVCAMVRDGKFEFSVWNSGAGFPPEVREKLFRKFSRLNVPELKRVGGSGVGLYLARQAVELHGGRIWAESEYGQWAKFSFEIPVEQGLRP